MNRKVGIVAVLLVAIALGAFREFVFINLNYSIDHLANHRPYSYAHSSFTALVHGLDLGQLVVLKWLLAALFIGVMLALTVLMSNLLFGDHRYRLVLAVGTAVLGTLALLLHFAGHWHPAFDLVSVKLLHLLQYPAILLFLGAASMLRRSP